MKFVEMFAGIGGMSHGLHSAGFECVAFAELDSKAHEAYKILHEGNYKKAYHDVSEVSDEELKSLGKVELLVAGFPCQPFSLAGKRGGFEDTRGTLFFEVARWAKALNPDFILLENVRGLLNHDKGRTYQTIVQTLHEIGYPMVEAEILNSKDFGVPQNRERIFILASKRTHLLFNPILEQLKERALPTVQLMQWLDDTITDQRYFLNDIMSARIEEQLKDYDWDSNVPSGKVKRVAALWGMKKQAGSVFDKRGISPTIKTPSGGYSEPIVLDNYSPRWRKLTPYEYFRLQSFPVSWADILLGRGFINSDLQRMAGNAVTSNVAEAIGKAIYAELAR